jgi:hypothetical protein
VLQENNLDTACSRGVDHPVVNSASILSGKESSMTPFSLNIDSAFIAMRFMPYESIASQVLLFDPAGKNAGKQPFAVT